MRIKVQVTMDQHIVASDWLWVRFGALMVREDVDTVTAMIEQVVVDNEY